MQFAMIIYRTLRGGHTAMYTTHPCIAWLPPDVMSETRCWERDGKDGDRLGAG